MSYCRWSTDNFQCDIYAYLSDSGYMIHVASNKTVGEPPKVDYSIFNKERAPEDTQRFVDQRKAQSEWLDKCERVPIGLPFDGETFTLETAQEFYDKMVELRQIGYKFPDYVLENIKEEILPV